MIGGGRGTVEGACNVVGFGRGVIRSKKDGVG